MLYRALSIGIVLGLAILALARPLEHAGFALVAEAAPGVEHAGREYFAARIWGAPAVLANFAFLGWFLGREDGRGVLAMTVTANLANIALDYMRIVRFDWAARGAGLATAASQYLMLAVALGLFFDRYRPSAWRWREVADRERLVELLALNRDILIRTVALITTFALFTNFSAVLGTVTLAANTILLRVQSLAAYMIDGAAFAAESLAGVFRGARDRERLDRLHRLALATGLCFALPFIAAVLAGPRPFVGLLTSHVPTLERTVAFAPWLVPVLTIGSLAYIYDGIFLGLTAGRTLRNSMLAATVLVFLPLALLALDVGSNALLWAAMSAYMVARVSTLAWAFQRLRRRF